jgi:hypothetical protein
VHFNRLLTFEMHKNVKNWGGGVTGEPTSGQIKFLTLIHKATKKVSIYLTPVL